MTHRLIPTPVLPVLLAALLSACSNSSDSDNRGALNSTVDVGTVSQAQVNAAASAGGFAALTSPAVCDVTIKRVTYQTVGGLYESTTASALVATPTGGTAANCDGKRPIMLYAHGTSDDKTKDMANTSDRETSVLMSMYAAQGYIVVAPNYTGYSGSTLAYHPYLIAEAQAYDAVDALRAAKLELAKQTRVTIGKIFVSGYSQGGYVAMATARALERDYRVEWPLAGAMPMSGPYDLPTFSSALFSGTSSSEGSLMVPMLVDAYQAVYKNIYTTASTIYNSPYNTTAPGLFPGTTRYATAVSSNKVPAALTGSAGLVADSYAASFTTTTGNTNALLANITTNTLLNFRPVAPMGLCYGAADPVIFASNSTAIRDYFKNTQTVTVEDYDLDSTTAFASASQSAIQTAWQSARSAGGAGFMATYHSAALPYCMALAKIKFDAIVAN